MPIEEPSSTHPFIVGFPRSPALGNRQVDAHNGALVQAGIHIDLTAMVIDNAIGGGHAQSAALKFGGEKGFENFSPGLAVHSAAIVCNIDTHILSRIMIRPISNFIRTDFGALKADLYPAFVGAGFGGVDQHGRDDHLDLSQVGFNRRNIRIKCRFDVNS